ncbi:MAG: xanthine dehydrogenase family protein molybdopterin-binding subunit [Synergistaceae bacterium]|nr:xanthine dehydrogenase family protein molybdopterin-binding subunit [Synergistaceae bacterium]
MMKEVLRLPAKRSCTTFKIIGKSIPRLDGIPKATGVAGYIDDYDLPGHWVGGIVRSGVPHGILRGFVKDPSFDWSKVTFLTASDIPGGNFIHIVRDDYPALTEKYVKYATEALALIAAPDAETLRAALDAVKPEIDRLPAALTLDEGLEANVKVWGEDNILDEYRVACGDLEKGFAESDVVVEGTYETGLQEQMYLETQGAAAIPLPDGGMEVILSLQCPYYVHNAVVQVLGLPKDKVVVRQAETGGGFGGKEDYSSMMGAWAALLAWKSGHAVKLVYDRKEDLETTPKRHPSRIRQKMGFRKDGALVAMEADLLLDGGAYTTLTRVILQRATLHATGAYRVPNAMIRGRAIATNTPPTGAFRGFGAPQVFFAVERNMDKAAKILGMDPLDLRLRNVIRDGDLMPHNQRLEEGVSAEAVLLRAAELSGYREKRAAYSARQADGLTRGGRARRGIGLSVVMHGGGFTGSGEDNMGTTVRLDYKDGLFRVLCSSVDMGQGSATVLPMIAAEALGIEVEFVRALPADTDVVPDSGPTVASRTTMFVGAAVYDACRNMTEKLQKYLCEENGGKLTVLDAARAFAARNGEGKLSAEGIYKGPKPASHANPWNDEKFSGDAYKGYSWLATVVELEADTDTYEAVPAHVTAVAEIGRVIHPTLAEGQLAGGILQSLGWAHIEDLSITPEGRYSTSRMSSYLVPTTLDTPGWTIEIMENPCPAGAFGAKSLGELPCNGGAPAFLSALDNALGVFAEKIPAGGEYLFGLLNPKLP